MDIIKTNFSWNGTLKNRTSTEMIIVHHSGVSVLQSVETIHNYHKNTNGWAGIGYNFYVRKDGNVYEGRPIEKQGAHATSYNHKSIGVCFEGNFEQETMTDIQKNAGIELINYIKSKYGNIAVKGHRDVNSTTCPGKNFPLEELKNGQAIQQVVQNVEELKTLARNTNLRAEPNSNEDTPKTLYLANTTLYILEPSVAQNNGYTWDRVRIRVNGKEGYMINQNYK